MYSLPKWKDPGRKRKIHISYKDPDFCKHYDLDLDDFTDLVTKLHSGQRLTPTQDERYASYLYTIIFITMENPKFRTKPADEKFELFDKAIYELVMAMPGFNPQRGSSIYSYAYRCCYVAFCHYYSEKNKELEKQLAIEEHCREELKFFYDEFIDFHKTEKH